MTLAMVNVLPESCDTEQCLGAVAVLDAVKKLVDSLGLAASWLEIGGDLKARAGAALGKGSHNQTILGCVQGHAITRIRALANCVLSRHDHDDQASS